MPRPRMVAEEPGALRWWDPDLNDGIDPAHAEAGGQWWWRCPNGPDHVWLGTLTWRQRTGARGCGFCAGKRLAASNSLVTSFPAVAEEWHPTRNGELTPEDVFPSHPHDVWWRCTRGHDWPASPNNRTKPTRPSGCRHCGLTQRSQIEIRAVAELSLWLAVDVTDEPYVHAGRRQRVDAFDPERDIVLQYDGWHYHRGRVEADQRITAAISEAGYTVIRVREDPLDPIQPDLDVVVPAKPSPVDICVAVLRRIEQITGETFEGLDTYERDREPAAADVAAAYLDTRLEPVGPCEVDGCTRDGPNLRRWCDTHYKRWSTTGQVRADVPIRRYVAGRDSCRYPTVLDVDLRRDHAGLVRATADIDRIGLEVIADPDADLPRCGDPTVGQSLCKRHHHKLLWQIDNAGVDLAGLDRDATLVWLVHAVATHARHVAAKVLDGCAVPDAPDGEGRCGRHIRARGLCSRHYQQVHTWVQNNAREWPDTVDGCVEIITQRRDSGAG